MKNIQAFLKRANFCGFTSLTQVRVFLAVAEVEGETTAKAISEATGLEASQVSTVFRSLSDWTLLDLDKRREMVDGREAVRVYARMSNPGRTSLDMMKMEVRP